MKQKLVRDLHRDLGYFFLGLIITFAFSGILMNHRDAWHPEKYTVETKAVEIKRLESKEISEEKAQKIGQELGIEDKFRRHKVKKGELTISYENNDVSINLETGKGELVTFIKTPVISQMMKLHKSTSNWWIYFSDIFGISLIVIAVTGTMMIKHGKQTFKQRGWKLALAGLIFPLLFLFFLN